MKRDFDSDNVKKFEVTLCKANAERIEKDPSGTRLTVKREDKYEILDLKENTFSLRLNSKVFVEPEALFCIYLEYRINYEFSHKVDTKFIEKNIEEILHPVGSEVSYVTSTLTKFLTDNYFIMPPTITIEQEKGKF